MPKFVAHILEYQIFQQLCIAAGQYTDGSDGHLLSSCSIMDSTDAGELLSNFMLAGNSQS